jgi:hypothetical protein
VRVATPGLVPDLVPPPGGRDRVTLLALRAQDRVADLAACSTDASRPACLPYKGSTILTDSWPLSWTKSPALGWIRLFDGATQVHSSTTGDGKTTKSSRMRSLSETRSFAVELTWLSRGGSPLPRCLRGVPAC